MTILRRHLLIIALTAILVTGAVAAILTQLQPIYVASAHIKLQASPTPSALSVAHIEIQPQFDPAVVGTAVQVIRSPSVARDVLHQLQLAKVPEFTKSSRLRMFVGRAERWLGVKSASPSNPEALDEIALRNLMGRLAVSSAQNSYVLAISAESENPDLSAKIANAFASTYLMFQRQLKARASRAANSLLSGHLEELKRTALELENAAEAFRAKSGLAAPSGSAGGVAGPTVAGQQLAELNSQLTAATKARLDKEAALDQMQALMQAGHPERAPQVLSSPVIQRMVEQESKIATQVAGLESRLGPGSQLLLAAPRAQLRAVQQQIAGETRRVAAGLRVEVATARAREAALRTRLHELQRQVNKEGGASVELKMLEAEAAADRSVYQAALARSLQTASDADMEQPDAELISTAQPPLEPAYPRRGLTLMLAAIGSTIFGIFLALTIERSRPGFRSAEEVEDATSLPVLGLIPKAGRVWLKRRRGGLLEKRYLGAEKALEGIHFRLWDRGSPMGRVVMVTSSVPKEGKTFVGISLALSLARSGLRVLLIDCDLRRPAVASAFKLSGSGLNTLFHPASDTSPSRDLACLDQLGPEIVTRISDQLHVVASFPAHDDPIRLLSSRVVESLISRARLSYDVIILDTPPILAVPDAGILSRLADSTLLVTRWRGTRRVVVGKAIRALHDYGADIAGVVLSVVNMRQYTFGRLDAYAYVHKSCQSYYRASQLERPAARPRTMP